MIKDISRLEFLPNEVLLELFRYFNARDLFRAFYNLNTRINELSQSFEDLHLVFQMKKSANEENIFSLYVYTLIIDSDIDVYLHQFPNTRRLKMESIPKNILLQLNSNILPHLEHLTSCPAGILNPSYECMSLQTLKLGCINSLNYTSILSACPNLRFLDIGITGCYSIFSKIVLHTNLQRMIIRIGDIVRSLMDGTMINYLSCVPNLKQLRVHLAIYDSTLIRSFLDYDWFGRIITDYLPLLRRFILYVYCFNLNGFNEIEIRDIRNQMKENFQIVHRDQYQSRMVIH